MVSSPTLEALARRFRPFTSVDESRTRTPALERFQSTLELL